MIGSMGDRGWHGTVPYFDDDVKRESLRDSLVREFGFSKKSKKKKKGGEK